MKRYIGVFLALLGSAAFAAEVENPNFLPFGEEEAYLGNAGIALSDSSGAVYYNPAALGFVSNNKASVYGNAYAFNRLSLNLPMGPGNPDLVIASNAYEGVPLSTVTILCGENWSYAFSVNMPYSSQSNLTAPSRPTEPIIASMPTRSNRACASGPASPRRSRIGCPSAPRSLRPAIPPK